jgi:adenosylhomocysteine nucleosidase
MRILMAASEPREFRGLLARAGSRSRVPAGHALDWARTARMGSHDLLLVANGAGARRAAMAVDALLATFRPDAVVSTGFCGALEPGLEVADIVVATQVTDEATSYPVAPLSGVSGHRHGVVRTIGHVAQTADEKRFWRSTGAVAVEMEAAGVAGRARFLGLPFYCVKAVSDLANETLAIDLNATLRPDGHFDTIDILGLALRRPAMRLPELYRLWNRALRASNSLGEFFADCRF